MDVAGFRMPLPTRMTIIRLADGGLWIHSPTTDDERVFAAVAALGPVRHLIAPNTIHYWWVPDWYRRFPDATVHLAPGVVERARRPLPPHRLLGDAAPEEWAGEKIGRESCRERVCQYVSISGVAVSLNKNINTKNSNHTPQQKK